MVTGSDNVKRTTVNFIVGGFGCGKSNFYEQQKEARFPNTELVGFDHVADPLVDALNAKTPEKAQEKLIDDVTHLKKFLREEGIINHHADYLPDDAPERLNELIIKRKEVGTPISRSDVRDVLRDEIAIYDGSTIVQKVRNGKHIILDSSGRPDIRQGVYELMQDNGLLEQCEFASYNMTAPCPKELANTATRRLLREDKGHNLYTSDEIEQNYANLYPAPIYIPDEHPLLKEDDKADIARCGETEKRLFSEGLLRTFFVDRDKKIDGMKSKYTITEILPSNQKAVIEQQSRVTNIIPPTAIVPNLIELVSRAKQEVQEL